MIRRWLHIGSWILAGAIVLFCILVVIGILRGGK